uniref:Uncharacterized protein n=1 Tax=Candidatus Kentrum sp. FW TaxID=2126338 RepID=A0A450TDV4_9GAMM|nr:MAG: hypothetical protein BECKFW1821A_GA0114235_11912 [Candidatus Kentron sp. FW]
MMPPIAPKGHYVLELIVKLICEGDREINKVLILFLTRYYQARLQYFERRDPGHRSMDELLDVAGEASSLHKVLMDFAEEGYTDTVDQIVSQTDALERLQRILTTALQRLGPPSEAERFYLCPEPVRMDTICGEPFEGGQTFELLAYLDRIDHQSNAVIKIEHCFTSRDRRQRWQDKTLVVMTEMVEFLNWVLRRLRQQPQAVPVPLLRDTLLVQLGLQLVRRHGIPVREPKPLLLSRKFLDTFQDGAAIYDALSSDVFYGILHEQNACDLTTLRHRFAAKARAHPGIPASFTQASRDYLAALALDGPPLMIESGMHGTFPLWLLTLMGNVGEMVLYTTVPWMYAIYQDIVFRKNYNYLRDIETIVAHDHLFRFSTISDGKVLVEETPHPITRDLALYELHLFKMLLKRKIHD